MFFTPYTKSMDVTVCVPSSTSLVFPCFIQEEESLDRLAVFYRHHTSSLSKKTERLHGAQVFGFALDFKHLHVAGPQNCNYNLAII
jgi:hypothetical protein